MLKHILRDMLIVLGVAVLYMSTSARFMQWVSDKRNEKETWWGVHKPVEGDLVNMGYLNTVNKFHSLRDYAFIKPADHKGNVALYLWGDSYTWKVPDTAYANISSYTFGWRYRDNINYALDTSKASILIIEITERNVRSYFSGTDMLLYVHKAQPTALYKNIPVHNYAGFSMLDIQELFNPNINQNLEYNLFNYNFINPIRYAKAAMNYYAFGRASGDVVIAKNGKQLFLKETVYGNKTENGYYPLYDDELSNIVHTLNQLYSYYRNDGFDEVYLSVIPNPATILQPEGYNRLIPRLQSADSLNMPLIDMYTPFTHADTAIYRPGDTHWNNAGMQIWLSEVNRLLRTY